MSSVVALLEKFGFNLFLKVTQMSDKRVSDWRRFQTVGAETENAGEEKTLFTCGRCSNGAAAEREFRVGR